MAINIPLALWTPIIPTNPKLNLQSISRKPLVPFRSLKISRQPLRQTLFLAFPPTVVMADLEGGGR